MRYAVLADIHGNLPALEAVLADLARHEVDGVLCLGDLVGYGPFPNECIAAVARLSGPVVAGNHDLIALGALSDARCIRLARRTLNWTRIALTPASHGFLAALPGRADAGGGVVLCHGTLDDPQEYLTTPTQAIDNLARLGTAADILLVGHTHRPLAMGADGRVLSVTPSGELVFGRESVVLNPGAVGQVRGGPVVARYLTLDTDERVAHFRQVGYNVARTRRELRRQGLPAGTYRLRRSAFGAVRRVGRLVVGAAARRV